jgi:hypothetical protein
MRKTVRPVRGSRRSRAPSPATLTQRLERATAIPVTGEENRTVGPDAIAALAVTRAAAAATTARVRRDIHLFYQAVAVRTTEQAKYRQNIYKSKQLLTFDTKSGSVA